MMEDSKTAGDSAAYQSGIRFGIYLPIPIYVLGTFAFSWAYNSSEASIAWMYIFWVYFGLVQWAYLGPLLLGALIWRKWAFAKGIVVSGLLLNVAHLIAYLIGIHGARW